eukprot:2884946-Rhodomonas_salina.2
MRSSERRALHFITVSRSCARCVRENCRSQMSPHNHHVTVRQSPLIDFALRDSGYPGTGFIFQKVCS